MSYIRMSYIRMTRHPSLYSRAHHAHNNPPDSLPTAII